MNMNMKQIRLFLYAAISALAVASCAKEAELVEPEAIASGEKTVLTLSLGGSDTKTALVGGKTTWTAGDVVRIYNATGTYSQDVEVPAAATGLASAELEVSMKDTMYFAVYPATAANGCSAGKVGIKLPSNPDGLFASANICAAQSKGTNLQMRNVTAVLKVNINSGNVIEILQVNAKNAMVGTYEADLSGADPVLTAKSGTKSATVAVGGVDGDYYIAVAPGTYAEEFSVTALRGNGGYQTLTSSQSNEIAINTIVPLGTIGNDLSKGLSGEGTEGNPYVISNLGEWGAFVASVNLGNPYADKYIKLDTDVEDGVNTPIGYYIAADEQFPFAGHFAGNNHSIKVDIEGENCKSQNYCALFGLVEEGSSITDLKISGSVNATGNYAGGLIGYARGGEKTHITVKNITSSIKVTTAGVQSAGIAGYSSYTDMENCVNSGDITGKYTIAGISAYAFHDTFKNCSNSGNINDIAEDATAMFNTPYGIYVLTAINVSNGTWTNGTGGVAGYAQNCSLEDVANTGNVNGFIKIGGIAGQLYWSNVTNGTNSGTIEAAGALNLRADSQMGMQHGSVAGGIAGYINTSAALKECTNNGIIKGAGGIGGIAGNIICTNNQYSTPLLQKCTNNGEVVASKVYYGGSRWNANPGTGGIAGMVIPFSTYGPSFVECVNKGNVSATATDAAANGANGVAGIAGRVYAGRNTLGGDVQIKQCINEGNITGGFWVGGMVGMTGGRYAVMTSILNCVNHGTITANWQSVKDNGIFVGGLAGGCNSWNASYRTRAHLRINNSYNDGDVLYAVEDHIKPYAGGIAGDVWANDSQRLQNDYNVGYVGTVSKKAPVEGADKFIGAIAGRQNGNYVHYCYFPKDVLPAVGSDGTAANATTVVGFDADGNLAMPVTANSIDCTTLLQALNEWQNYYVKNGYYNWTGAPAHPVFDTTMD